MYDNTDILQPSYNTRSYTSQTIDHLGISRSNSNKRGSSIHQPISQYYGGGSQSKKKTMTIQQRLNDSGYEDRLNISQGVDENIDPNTNYAFHNRNNYHQQQQQTSHNQFRKSMDNFQKVIPDYSPYVYLNDISINHSQHFDCQSSFITQTNNNNNGIAYCKEKRYLEELLEVISDSIPNPDLKDLIKDIINLQNEINLTEREANKLEHILTIKESEMKLHMKKGMKNTNNTKDIIALRKDIEKMREELLNSHTQSEIYQKRKTMLLEELKNVKVIEQRKYETIFQMEKNLGKFKEENEDLRLKNEELEHMNRKLQEKLKEFNVDKIALENENKLLKYGSNTIQAYHHLKDKPAIDSHHDDEENNNDSPIKSNPTLIFTTQNQKGTLYYNSTNSPNQEDHNINEIINFPNQSNSDDIHCISSLNPIKNISSIETSILRTKNLININTHSTNANANTNTNANTCTNLNTNYDDDHINCDYPHYDQAIKHFSNPQSQQQQQQQQQPLLINKLEKNSNFDGDYNSAKSSHHHHYFPQTTSSRNHNMGSSFGGTLTSNYDGNNVINSSSLPIIATTINTTQAFMNGYNPNNLTANNKLINNNSSQSTAKGFGPIPSIINESNEESSNCKTKNKIMFTVSEESNQTLVKEMEEDQKHLEQLLMKNRAKFKDKIKEARNMLHKFSDSRNELSD